MTKFLKEFWYEEEGMGTVEIVIIIAVLVAVALIFKGAIMGFATKLMNNAFSTNQNTSSGEVSEQASERRVLGN